MFSVSLLFTYTTNLISFVVCINISHIVTRNIVIFENFNKLKFITYFSKQTYSSCVVLLLGFTWGKNILKHFTIFCGIEKQILRRIRCLKFIQLFSKFLMKNIENERRGSEHDMNSMIQILIRNCTHNFNMKICNRKNIWNARAYRCADWK